MKVAYRFAHRYYCDGRRRTRDEKFCASLHGPTIDAAVTEAFFEAIRPAQLDALEAVLAAQAAEGEQLSRQWQERLKRSRYEAHLAQRQYDAVDPDNRLVAGELERRCPQCSERITRETGWHLHHWVWVVNGGDESMANLALMHPTCHLQLHAQIKREKGFSCCTAPSEESV
jgi:hypothetical protein